MGITKATVESPPYAGVVLLLKIATGLALFAGMWVAQMQLDRAYYALTTAHTRLGTFTQLAALYILLSAGTHVLPQRLRITKDRPWMRSVLMPG